DSRACRLPGPAPRRAPARPRHPNRPPMVISWPLPLLLARRAGRWFQIDGDYAALVGQIVFLTRVQLVPHTLILFQEQFQPFEELLSAEVQDERLTVYHAADADLLRAADVQLDDLRLVLPQHAQHSEHQIHLLAPRLDIA